MHRSWLPSSHTTLPEAASDVTVHCWCLHAHLHTTSPHTCRGGYYFYIRFTGVNMLHWQWWPTLFIVLELIGVSSFFPYAILLTRGVYPTGSEGLPPAPKEKMNRTDGPAK